MVQRTENQLRGAAAENRVLSFLSDAGWTGEKLGSDFGEDLAFKFFYEEYREPIRVFVQVKSGRKSRKYIPIKSELLRIWQRSVDIHLLFLESGPKEPLRVFAPNMILDPVDLFQTHKKSRSIPVIDFFVLDSPELVDELTWMVRVEALERGHSFAQGQRFACQFPKGNPNEDLADGYSVLSASYLHHFLKYAGLVSINCTDVFELGTTEEADWFLEYGRKICRGEKPKGEFGDTFVEEATMYIRMLLHQREIPLAGGHCLVHQAAQWFVNLVVAHLDEENIDTETLRDDASKIDY